MWGVAGYVGISVLTNAPKRKYASRLTHNGRRTALKSDSPLASPGGIAECFMYIPEWGGLQGACAVEEQQRARRRPCTGKTLLEFRSGVEGVGVTPPPRPRSKRGAL
ncbi:hypothetical protein ANANG_G00228200 [Anguilla anguilla]|uniref:Uncharacterized protein n=1 Tax=Anguilla anguilla TaxID=7936 RepID=A0A9D3LZ99_ANGAN|nr:hypothetical protein ANANG_G00228200 [Anguilla anguilla]